MSELHRVIADLKAILNQTSHCSNNSKCECEDLRRRLRQKDRALKKVSRRVTELETVIRIRRSASMPMSVRPPVPRQDSTQSEGSYRNRTRDVTYQCAHDTRECNNGISPHNNHQRSHEFLHFDHRPLSSASCGSSFEDGYQRCLIYQDSVSSSSSQSQSVDLPDVQNNECNKDTYKIGKLKDGDESKANDIIVAKTFNEHPQNPETSFFDDLEAVFRDPNLLTDSGLLLSDISSNSDTSSIDDIDDL